MNHHVDQLTLTEKAHDSLGALANNVRGGEGDRCLVQQQRLQASLYFCFSTFLFNLSFKFVFYLYLHQYFPSPQGRQLFGNLFQLWIVPQVQSFQAGQAGEGHRNVLESDNIMMMVMMMVMIIVGTDIVIRITIILANFTPIVDLESVL